MTPKFARLEFELFTRPPKFSFLQVHFKFLQNVVKFNLLVKSLPHFIHLNIVTEKRHWAFANGAALTQRIISDDIARA
jgi:hypothetical protein